MNSYRKGSSQKRGWSVFLVLASVMVATYLAVIGGTSIMIAVTHINEAGFWAPLAFGILISVVVVILYLIAVRSCMSIFKKIR